MPEPLVSYVVVTHDRAPQQVCDRIIASVANQTHTSKELILVGECCDHIDEFRDRLATLVGFERSLVSRICG